MNRKRKLRVYYKMATFQGSGNLESSAGWEKSLMGMGLGLGLGAGIAASGVIGRETDTPVQIEEPKASEVKFGSEIELVDYEIQKGDYLDSIARKNFPGHAAKALDAMKKYNPNLEMENLEIGKKIKIPKDRKTFVDFYKLEENHSMSASSNIKEFIKLKENMISKKKDVEPNDGRDIYTIGYGHRLDTKDKAKEYENIIKLKKELSPNDPIVKRWFEDDIKEAEKKIKFLSLPRLNQNQFDALVSFTFNTGHAPKGIERLLEKGDISGAANLIRNDKSAKMQDQPGLGSRRSEEADLFEK